ncbi:MAG: hypothetical protein GY711_30730 [bacterium]|nr:hypothetical protein [bacterium]
MSDDDAGTSSGSAYVFVRNGTSWTQQAKLTASDANIGDQFGRGVSIWGDTIIVGAPTHDDVASNSGAVYVFTRSGTTWTEQAKLTVSDAGFFTALGGSIAIFEDTIVATADGGVYVFMRSGATWTEKAKLQPDPATDSEGFGFDVAVMGDTVAAGARLASDAGNFSGAAYVFSWTLVSDPGLASCFGAGCPCGNDYPTGGCTNRLGNGASLCADGTASIAADDLVLIAGQVPAGTFGFFLMGDAAGAQPLFDGDDSHGETSGEGHDRDPVRQGLLVDVSGQLEPRANVLHYRGPIAADREVRRIAVGDGIGQHQQTCSARDAEALPLPANLGLDGAAEPIDDPQQTVLTGLKGHGDRPSFGLISTCCDHGRGVARARDDKLERFALDGLHGELVLLAGCRQQLWARRTQYPDVAVGDQIRTCRIHHLDYVRRKFGGVESQEVQAPLPAGTPRRGRVPRIRGVLDEYIENVGAARQLDLERRRSAPRGGAFDVVDVVTLQGACHDGGIELVGRLRSHTSDEDTLLRGVQDRMNVEARSSTDRGHVGVGFEGQRCVLEHVRPRSQVHRPPATPRVGGEGLDRTVRVGFARDPDPRSGYRAVTRVDDHPRQGAERAQLHVDASEEHLGVDAPPPSNEAVLRFQLDPERIASQLGDSTGVVRDPGLRGPSSYGHGEFHPGLGAGRWAEVVVVIQAEHEATREFGSPRQSSRQPESKTQLLPNAVLDSHQLLRDCLGFSRRVDEPNDGRMPRARESDGRQVRHIGDHELAVMIRGPSRVARCTGPGQSRQRAYEAARCDDALDRERAGEIALARWLGLTLGNDRRARGGATLLERQVADGRPPFTAVRGRCGFGRESIACVWPW